MILATENLLLVLRKDKIMSNILNVYERNDPTVSIMKNADQRNQETNIACRYVKASDVTPKDIEWCDVFQMIRTMDPYSLFLAKRAKETGCFIVSMYDDDLYSMPNSYPLPPYRKNCVRDALRISDVLRTCSPHIQNKYRDLTGGKRAVCGNSVVKPEEVKLIAEKQDSLNNDPVKILYAANPNHVGFFNHFIMPVMPKLAERYAGKISMTFMGVKPELSQFEDLVDIVYWSTMPLEEYRQKVQVGDYDIGLSPLLSNDFTKCKYFNKFIEYTMAGVVGVYSNTEPYTYIVEDGKNGFLVDDDPEDWYECLCRVIDDALLRNRCICQAQQMLLELFSPERVRTSEAEQLPELLHYDAPRSPCKGLQPQKLLSRCIPVFDRVYQTWFYLRHTGFSGFIERVKIHLRNQSAYSK